MMYSYYLQEPKKWTGQALEECCIDLFPRKISAGKEFYEAVEPVLTAFFKFLQHEGLISNSKPLISKLKTVAPQMIDIANNPHNCGPAKQMMMGAVKAGIDPTDQQALNQYIMTYNQQQVASNHIIRTVTKIGRNELCPCGSGKKYKKCCGIG